MKAIVFGGSGFLGSHVADALTAKGCEVVIFDLVTSPYISDKQKMIVGDILNKDQVQKAIAGCDYVYNFAGIASLDDATTKPLDTVNLNVLGNINVMDACVKAKVKRFVYASSIYVYSQRGGFYRCSKQAAETYIEEYNRRFGLDFTILRFGTLYGTRANENNSIYRYLQQALENGRIVCDGSGFELREYINVKDAARLSVDILDDTYKNRHIIISGHHPMKFVDMLNMIKEIMQKDVKIELSQERNNDHYDLTPYSFIPKIGHKLVSNCYLDMGQGLLECLHEMSKDYGK